MNAGWWERFFASPEWVAYHHAAWDREETIAECQAVEELLRLPEGGSLLDVPCGNGRHAIEFAAAGYRVTGIDLSEPLLDAARAEAKRRKVSVDFRRLDMTTLDMEQAFHGACCLWGSIGYDGPEADRRFFAAVHRALKPGARFVLDTLSAETVFAGFSERRWISDDPATVLREDHYDPATGRLTLNWRFIDPEGRRTGHEASLQLYTAREIVAMLTETGFTDPELYGDTDLADFEIGAPRLIIAATA